MFSNNTSKQLFAESKVLISYGRVHSSKCRSNEMIYTNSCFLIFLIGIIVFGKLR